MIDPPMPERIEPELAKVVRAQIRYTENLIREHFAATPLALASVIRTGIMPWNVEVQVKQVRPEFGEDADSFRLHINEYVRVREYPRGVRPGRWPGGWRA